MATFVDLYLQGNSLPEAIDDYIDQWHKGGSDQSLWAFLGMTLEEYTAWMKNPEILTDILEKRQSAYPPDLSVTALGHWRLAGR